ncbi:MAG: hypothetical protein OXU25_01995 [Thaumarchaeota archaeon]|nr:hypothetical protein [Nitrososphaerota archaeon]
MDPDRRIAELERHVRDLDDRVRRLERTVGKTASSTTQAHSRRIERLERGEYPR